MRNIGWLEDGWRVALQYFKEGMYSKHKEEWVYYGIVKENSKNLFWNWNENYLGTKTTQESIRFPNPDNDPYVAVRYRYEIQIDELAQPDGKPIHGTGVIHGSVAPSIMKSKPSRQCLNYGREAELYRHY